MATQLLCPQCRVPLSASAVRGEPGECPRCNAAYAAPKVKSTKSAVRILQSKPYAPPPATQSATQPSAAAESVTGQVRGPILVTAIAAALVIAGIVWVIRMPAPATDVAATPKDPVAKIHPTKIEPTRIEPLPLLREPTSAKKAERPRVRPIQPRDPGGRALLDPVVRPPASDGAPQEAVDKAIDAGIQFLKTNPHRWFVDHEHEMGYASLPALALLEAGVPGDDPIIQKAANVVRRLAPRERNTYDLSLAVLFLDKLGDPADEPLIRSLGLRLVAGQTSLFGWDYRCPLLGPETEAPLFAAIESLQPRARLGAPLSREAGKGLIDLQIPLSDARAAAAGKPARPDEPGLVMPFDLGRPGSLVKELPEGLRDLPIVRPQPPGGPTLKGRGDRDDNSNTQFTLLALWAARRHGVPVDRSLLLADRRFALSQTGGGWGYRVHDGHPRPTMTCVGLLGLALGHGALLPENAEPKRRQPGGDPAIDKGLSALAASIGRPGDKISSPNLYLLWSIERVGVLYNLPTIGGKDWYGWGAAHLLGSQRSDGSWPRSEYHGSDTALDTAFALLFLNRTNLVPDLTRRLQLHMPIVDRDP